MWRDFPRTFHAALHRPRSFPTGTAPLLDLRNDLVFKLLFTRAPHLLADLINAVRHDEAPIVVERILNPQIDAGDLDGKTIVLDLHARDATGQLYNIEMQVRRYERWPARSAYYLARTLSEQIQRGQDYELLKPAIAIHFLAHDLFDDPAQANWRFELRDRRQPTIRLGKELQLHIIELPKAERLGCLPAALSAWVACFQHGWEEASMKDITHEPVREAVGRLKVLIMDEDARWRAYAREKAIADDAAALAYATRTGMEQGLEQGRARGLEQGLERGVNRAVGKASPPCSNASWPAASAPCPMPRSSACATHRTPTWKPGPSTCSMPRRWPRYSANRRRYAPPGTCRQRP